MKLYLTCLWLLLYIACYGQFRIGHNNHNAPESSGQKTEIQKTDSLTKSSRADSISNAVYDKMAKKSGIKDELIGGGMRVISVDPFPFFNQSMLTPMSLQLQFWFTEGNLLNGIYAVNFKYPSKNPIHIKEGSRLWIGLAEPSNYPEAVGDSYSEKFEDNSFRYIIEATYVVPQKDFEVIAKEAFFNGVDRIMFIKTVDDFPLAQKEFVYRQNIKELGEYLFQKHAAIQMYLTRYK